MPYGLGEFLTVCSCDTDDNSYRGDVLQVLAANPPFYVVANHSWPEVGPVVLNADRARIMRLTDDFVVAAIGDHNA